MKKLLIFTVTALVMFGCGSSNGEKYSVTDDGNGTKSPRISKVLITQFTDNNETNVKTILYRYDKNNLLVEKKRQDNDVEDTKTYIYNNLKQIKKLSWTDVMWAGGSSKFIYDDVLYAKTKLPIVLSNEYEYGFNLGGRTVNISYEYEYNDKDEAIRLASSKTILKSSSLSLTDQELINTVMSSSHYIYNKNGKIIQEILEDAGTKSTYRYLYNSFGKLSMVEGKGIKYFYNNKGLLISSEKYNDNVLIEKREYSYENKPYYSNPSPSYMDQGQYSSSGIY